VPRQIPWKVVALGSAVLGTIGAVVFSKRSADSTPPKRVALIGDSYAVGLGPQLAKLLSPFQYEGHVGIGTAAWASHAATCGTCGDWLTTFKPDIVLVSLGVNDGATPSSANYQAIVQNVHGGGARVVWIEPPAAVNTPAVRAVIASLGVATVPATLTPLGADGLHPVSYAPWAGEIAKTL